MKKFLKSILPILISLIIVIVFNGLVKIKNTTTDKNNSIEAKVSEAPIEGVGFSIKDGGNLIYSIDKNKIKNYKFILSNNTDEQKNFSLTILAGYKQQTFKYENKDTDMCNLSVEPKSEIVLPIELNETSNNNLSNYTFTFIPNSNEKVYNVSSSDMYKYKDFTFIIPVTNFSNDLEFKADDQNRESFELDGLNVIPYATNEELKDRSFSPKYEVKRKKDEKVLSIPIIIGGGECNDYLVYCLVNGKQVLINGECALRYNIKEKNGILENIKVNIEGSIESEVIFFIIPNPQNIGQHQDIESSYRFTIVGE